MQVSWVLEKDVLQALLQMRGPEGGVFNRDQPLNVYRGSECPFQAKIGISDVRVSSHVFDEMVSIEYIARHSDGSTWEQWRMTEKGLKALQDAGMDTKEGKLSRDDISWLTGTGRFAQ